MKHVFFIIIGFYFFITTAGILFIGMKLFVVKESVESLMKAEKGLVARLELRDTIYRLKDAVAKDISGAETKAIIAKTDVILSECYGCHSSNAFMFHIRDAKNAVKQLANELEGGNSHKKQKRISIIERHISPFAEDSYAKVKALSEPRVEHVRQELYKVRETGIYLVVMGLLLFAGFSALSMRRISRLEREAAEKELRIVRSEKLAALGRLIAGVAHELNTPLTAVSGFSELLLKTGADDNVRNMAGKINTSAVRMTNIVKDLLIFAEAPKLERTPVNVKDLFLETVDLAATALNTCNISADISAADDLTVFVDKSRMERVLLNLLTNAAQAVRDSKKGNRILLSAFRNEADNAIIIEVSDNGPGICGEIIKKIFDPFFTTKQFGKGTGLGLSISYSIVKAHGGDMKVKSMEGEGTTFTIELPAKLQNGGNPSSSA
ncbi:MAG: hypothetical protein A2Z82_11375 [Nitrospirae bacterium GWA2_46_11]|nr:MAG: hypothetical protein A2Z82_11375 [Nitrospirae bacterium GWA2_46_11]